MKKDMPLEGLRWSRDSGSALYDTPQNGRSRTGWGANASDTDKHDGSNLAPYEVAIHIDKPPLCTAMNVTNNATPIV